MLLQRGRCRIEPLRNAQKVLHVIVWRDVFDFKVQNLKPRVSGQLQLSQHVFRDVGCLVKFLRPTACTGSGKFPHPKTITQDC